MAVTTTHTCLTMDASAVTINELYTLNQMKKFGAFSVFLFLSLTLFAQAQRKNLDGVVSYISTQNVYVKFENTDGIHIGDTLYLIENGQKKAAVIAKNISSISCVGSPISAKPLKIGTQIVAITHTTETNAVDLQHPEKSKESVALNDVAIKKATNRKGKNGRFDGKIAISSYSNFAQARNNSRYRYNLSMNANRIKNSKFSSETYLSFSHSSYDTKSVSSNLSHYLKVYSLAVKYDIDSTSSLSLGRKININMANIGAVDGLQYEKQRKNITYGALVGFRPDYYDYGFNPNLLQAGVFVSHNILKQEGSMQTSLALFNQTNNLKTDRRFAYLQYSNSLVKNVDFFSSFEVDFYTLKNMQPATTLDLTSAYLSLRVRPFRPLSLTLSYDARKNIYYYETFKNQLDSILDHETRQGVRFQFNYRPFKFLTWGGNAGYRFQKQTVDSIKPPNSFNANSYLSFPNLPFIETSLMLNATYLDSKYTSGFVYGATISRDILPGKISADLEYRYADFKFSNSENREIQNIAEISLSWRIAKKLYLSADYEATFEQNNNAQRIFLNLTQRF